MYAIEYMLTTSTSIKITVLAFICIGSEKTDEGLCLRGKKKKKKEKHSFRK